MAKTAKVDPHRVTHILNVLARYVLAAVFVFSGFVKAIDPRGVAYKLGEYAAWMGLPVYEHEWLLWMSAVALAAVEFVLGVYLLLGIRRRFTATLLLCIMAVFTPLTLWLALRNPVSNCGCFGEALVLTNWETFAKNVVLLACAVAVWRERKRLSWHVPLSAHWLVSLYTMLFILLLSVVSLIYLPLLDFRPYKVGVNIAEAMTVPADAPAPEYDTRFIMERDGEQREFDLAHYPDSTWTHVRTVNRLVREGYVPPIRDFFVVDEAGEDVTYDLLADTTVSFWIVSPSFDRVEGDYTDELNTLYDYCREQGYHLCGITASSAQQVARWRYRTGATYPIYYADDVMLKTMIRANPGVMQMKAGTILNKWSCNGLPDFENAPHLAADAQASAGAAPLSMGVLLKFVFFYFVPLLFITFAHKFWLYRRQRKRGQNERGCAEEKTPISTEQSRQPY